MNLPYEFVFSNFGDISSRNNQINLSTLAVVHSLDRRKIPVVLITNNKRDGVAKSSYVKNIEFCPSMHESEEQLLEFFLELSHRYQGKKVLLPTVDEYAWFIGRHHELLSNHYLIPAPNDRTMSKINNKRFQYETAEHSMHFFRLNIFV